MMKKMEPHGQARGTFSTRLRPDVRRDFGEVIRCNMEGLASLVTSRRSTLFAFIHG